MKYPKEIGPQSQTEALAILFSMLGNAYNMLAQYEAEDEKREREGIDDLFGGRHDPAKSAAAHREDERQ